MRMGAYAPVRCAAKASRRLALLQLLAERGLLAPGFLGLRSEIFELLHLANFDHFVVRIGTALGPFHSLFLRVLMTHPVAAANLITLRPPTVGTLRDPPR